MTTTTLPPTDDPVIQRWSAIVACLREQAIQLNPVTEDRRDAAYWEIVAPLFDEVNRVIPLV